MSDFDAAVVAARDRSGKHCGDCGQILIPCVDWIDLVQIPGVIAAANGIGLPDECASSGDAVARWARCGVCVCPRGGGRTVLLALHFVEERDEARWSAQLRSDVDVHTCEPEPALPLSRLKALFDQQVAEQVDAGHLLVLGNAFEALQRVIERSGSGWRLRPVKSWTRELGLRNAGDVERWLDALAGSGRVAALAGLIAALEDGE